MEQSAWQAAQRAARFDSGRAYRQDTRAKSVFDIESDSGIRSAGIIQKQQLAGKIGGGSMVELDWAGNIVRRPIRQRPQTTQIPQDRLTNGLVPNDIVGRHQSRKLFSDRDLRQHSYQPRSKARQTAGMPSQSKLGSGIPKGMATDGLAAGKAESPGSKALAQAVAQSGPGGSHASASSHWMSSTQAMLGGKRHSDLGLEPRRGRGRLPVPVESGTKNNGVNFGPTRALAHPHPPVDAVGRMHAMRARLGEAVLPPGGNGQPASRDGRRYSAGASRQSNASGVVVGLGPAVGMPRSTSPMTVPRNASMQPQQNRMDQMHGLERVAAHRDGMILGIVDQVSHEVDAAVQVTSHRPAMQDDALLGRRAASNGLYSGATPGVQSAPQEKSPVVFSGGAVTGYSGKLPGGVPRRLGQHSYFYRGR